MGKKRKQVVKLPLQTAHLIELDDGTLAVALDRELRKAYLDCVDRHAVTAAREVTLKVKIAPLLDQTGRLDNFDVRFAVSSKTPERELAMRMTEEDGELVFGAFKDNPDQLPLPGTRGEAGENEHDAE